MNRTEQWRSVVAGQRFEKDAVVGAVSDRLVRHTSNETTWIATVESDLIFYDIVATGSTCDAVHSAAGSEQAHAFHWGMGICEPQLQSQHAD